MLWRHVETILKTNGTNWPYRQLPAMPERAWVGNFEATVPDQHRQTPNFTFAFSVDKALLLPLREAGFEYLNLANNHTFDFGADIFSKTRENLSDFGVFGDPNLVSENSIAYAEVGEDTVALIGIHAVWKEVDEIGLKNTLALASQNSDMQVVYVHWGNEYELVHNETQANLAKRFIDAGADAVIGHHPHVVQDVALYNGVPIFYSLGNFIFDQYFDANVQQGLVVTLVPTDDELKFVLEPATSIGSPASPRLMSNGDKQQFLAVLADRSEPGVAEAIRAGELILPRN
jgi:poly-gamma-glutamate synthesis protein (capsule biosynthesis protein)